MATWVDVTAPSNWTALQTAHVSTAFGPDCTTATTDTVGIDILGLTPEGMAGIGHARVDRVAVGSKYEWNGSRWVPSDYLASPPFSSSDIPLLEYVGALTGIQKIRITAELHSAQVVDTTTNIMLPFGSWPAGAVCPDEPFLSFHSSFAALGSYPAAQEFIAESDYPCVFATAAFANIDSEGNAFTIGEMMDITKIEMYADAAGDFWADFIDLTET